MTILAGDIRLFKSQVMLDTTDGGGMITANEVVDGVSNNMFPDISELDRTYGRVALRKVFSAVNTDNVDSYYGAHAIVTKPPSDPEVSVTLFSTEDWADIRAGAQSRMESYLAEGPRLFGQLYGTQLEGQRAITMLFRVGRVYPDVADSIVLVMDEGLVTEVKQFVRITEKTVVEQDVVVSYPGGIQSYRANVITYEISDSLRYDFIGPDPLPYDNYPGVRSWGRSTVVANAATYYGISKLTSPIVTGALSAKVDTIFSQLVPSGRVEVSLTDTQGAVTPATPILASVTDETYSSGTTIGPAQPLYLTGAVHPDTLIITSGATTLVDDGGLIKNGSTVVGEVDYASGVVTFTVGSPTYSNPTATWSTSARPFSAAETKAYLVTSINRAYVWNHTFTNPVGPGAVTVSYMSQGKWYDIYDQGNGLIKSSDPALGSGSVNYATGTVSITTGALPDIDSAILFYSGQGNTGYRPIDVATNGDPYFEITAGGKCIAPNSVSLTWTDGSARTLTDNGSGVLTGYGSGTVDYRSGVIKAKPTNFPATGTVVSHSLNTATLPTPSYTYVLPSGSPRTINTGLTNIQPGTADIQVYTSNVMPEAQDVGYPVPDTRLYSIKNGYEIGGLCVVALVDNGGGQLINEYDGSVMATINYSTGVVTFPGTTVGVVIEKPNFGAMNVFTAYITETRQGTILTTVQAQCRAVASLVTGSQAGTTTITSLKMDLRSLGQLGGIVSGSLRYTWGSFKYYDKQGLLYRDFNMVTGGGTACGTVDSVAATVTMTHWTAGAARPSLKSMAVAQSSLLAQRSDFRVPAAPVLNGSFQIRADFIEQAYDLYVPALSSISYGATISPYGTNYKRLNLPAGTVTCVAQVAGEIVTPPVTPTPGTIVVYPALTGTIDYVTGVVSVAAEMRAIGWSGPDLTLLRASYPNNVNADDEFVVPIKVDVTDLLYNAVTFAYIPLDADILGLDPVRLPTDGRVPIFSSGLVAVVHNTQTTSFAGGASSGAVLNLGRTRIASIKVTDSAATPLVVSTNDYTANLDAGTVTLSGSYSAANYTTPIKVEHRIEDMALVSDAQITGDLTFTRQISHDYPANTSYVSSALIIGDQQARVTGVFDQQTWSNVFLDDPSGSSATGTFNIATYPIAVENKDCIQQRWALVFTDSNNFRIIGENVGQIGVGDVNTNLNPNNPNTGQPYFSLNKLGWGGGWVSGNVLRFNTIAANFPIWVARTVQQSTATVLNDYFQMQVRGDVDTP